MAITFHPKPGQILMCDFSKGFQEPEMVKAGRPVVVLSKPLTGRDGLVTVVPLSSTRPQSQMPYHLLLPPASLPQLGMFEKGETWVKGDMVYTVGFHRLDLIRLGKRDPKTRKRLYFTNRLSRERMREIYGCVLCGLSLTHLVQYLAENDPQNNKAPEKGA